MHTGRCECGKVRFTVPKLREAVSVCHCSQCRRTSGHLWAATRAPFDSLTFSETDGLAWYASSDFAKRGFCKFCGSSLFYRINDAEDVGIAAGCIEDPQGLFLAKHIFTKDKGQYYDIADNVTILETY